ncbi:BrnT family toxin [Xanthobacter pseudotagetidis]|uniref:BrnT family toxin n=1 Tax=Xanthobacter pseudotagetidis TaxID=3119911 RepID=UPI00372ABFE1
MDFEWDESKRQDVVRKRSVDILYAALIFDGPILTRIDSRKDYGEERKISIGMIEDECFVVVYTERDGGIRLITAWKGGRHERSSYQASLARGNPEDEGKG